MEITKESLLKIQFKDKEAENFTSLIKAIKKKISEVGFNSNFLNENEVKILNEIHKQL